KDLDAAIRLYGEVFGLEPAHRWHASDDRMEAASFHVGGIEIELMQPTSEDSPIAKFIAKRGEGIHHVAYKVDDVADALHRASAPTPTGAGSGPCASTRASAPPPSPTSATSTCWSGARPVSRSPSTCPPRSATTPTIRWPAARSGR